MSERRAVFLDRDGVLNKADYIEGKSYPPADADSLEIISGAREAIARLREAGYLCICVTNQPDVARGTRTLENVEAMNNKVCKALELDDLFVCLHDNKDNCLCRKPKTGMLLAAAQKWRIDLPGSWMVGDRETDIHAGNLAGCRGILVAGSNAEAHSLKRVTICEDIIAAAAVIVASGNGRQ